MTDQYDAAAVDAGRQLQAGRVGGAVRRRSAARAGRWVAALVFLGACGAAPQAATSNELSSAFVFTSLAVGGVEIADEQDLEGTGFRFSDPSLVLRVGCDSIGAEAQINGQGRLTIRESKESETASSCQQAGLAKVLRDLFFADPRILVLDGQPTVRLRIQAAGVAAVAVENDESG